MTTTHQASDQQEHVLSTLNADGSRRWIKPWVSLGRYLRRRRIVAYVLIVLFSALPYMRIAGKPPILLDIAAREFTFFGITFYPTDTLPLAFFVIGVFVTIFLLTAILGRVWCGWACPQTVYLEFIYRPIERFFEGKPGRKKKVGVWRKPAKLIVYLFVSMFLAHTFLAYFVGIDKLLLWVRSSPIDHPTAFLVMGATTFLMMFDFAFFREQMCLIACPYGRFQSVMLDRQSLIVSYDANRGEPRGKAQKKNANTDLSLPVVGDCVDCGLCVRTCPTGIDIRDGLQMECVTCAQCIDACDAVMTKLGRPQGLIRYTSQAALEGEKFRLLRPRVMIYPLLLAFVLTALGFTVGGREPAETHLLRGYGAPFIVLPDGSVSNQLRVTVRNRTDIDHTYTVTLVDAPRGRIEAADNPFSVDPGKLGESSMTIIVPADSIAQGKRDVHLLITSDAGFETKRAYRLLGPYSAPTPTPAPSAPIATDKQMKANP